MKNLKDLLIENLENINETELDSDHSLSPDYMMAWIDGSASMTDDQLKLCLSEVYKVARAKKPSELVVVQCDTKIRDIKTYTNLRQLKKDMTHATLRNYFGSGSELKPCWDLLINDPTYKGRQCELVMIFTDGYLIQYKRDPQTMKHLCWYILDNPYWNLEYKDNNTDVIHLNS